MELMKRMPLQRALELPAEVLQGARCDAQSSTRHFRRSADTSRQFGDRLPALPLSAKKHNMFKK